MSSRAPKRDRVAKGVRAAIESGYYADGQLLSQERLAAEYGVDRGTVWNALAVLRHEGLTSLVANRYVVNANHVSRNLERVLSRLDDIEQLVRIAGHERLAGVGRIMS